MRPRNREVNIFSLSLMDVISGAMGAFLIIMIILARYYVFDPEVTQNVDELKLRLDAAVQGLNRIRGGTEEIFDETIKSKSGASTSGLQGGDALDQIEALSRGIRDDVDRVNAQLGEVQAQLNDVEDELQEKSAQLKRADERIEDLQKRNAMTVQIFWDCDRDINLFIESDRTYLGTDQRDVSFDPRVQRYQSFRGDTGSNYAGGPGAELQMIGQAVARSEYKIFIYLNAPVSPGSDCWVKGTAVSWTGFFTDLGNTNLTTAQSFDFLGVVKVDEDYEFSYAEPTDAERRRELDAVRERMRTTPVPKTEGEQ